MELFEFTSELELESFLSRQKTGHLLQSWVWGDILKSGGCAVRRLGVKQSNRLVLAATAVRKSSGAGLSYWLISRGPVIAHEADSKEAVRDFFFSELARMDKRAIFIRFEPAETPAPGEGEFQFSKTINLEPAETLVLDLAKSDSDLLAQMHPKTRYNIRLAEKKGVAVELKDAVSEADISEFLRLINLTGTRDGFRLHPASHYRRLLTESQGMIKLGLASYEGKNIAAGLFSFWHDQATYLHGASDNEFRNVMAPYLLQWAAIKEARRRGCQSYDFYGIDAQKWPGVTRFKQGFGGQKRKLPGTYDAVISPVKYNLYRLLRIIRRKLS